MKITDTARPLFAKYYELLAEWNTRFNLTAVIDRDEVFVRHFEDSLAAYDIIRGISDRAWLCDVGSGAGFPGIPLKIALPNLRVTLLDSLEKRVGFLNAVISELGLEGINAAHLRAEDAGKSPDYREAFDFTTARAVAPLPSLLEYALPLTKIGGAFIAWKTGDCGKEIAAAECALRTLGGGEPRVIPYTICGADMALVIVPKCAPSPLRYPRGGNKPRSKPL